MDDDEALRIESRIRGVLLESRLAWALPEIDATIAEGIPVLKSVSVERSSYVAFDEPQPRRRSRGRETMSSTRPLSPQERLQVTMNSLRQLTIEPLRMREEIVTSLGAAAAEPIQSVTFIAEGAQEPAFRATRSSDRQDVASERRQRIEQLDAVVRRLQDEVN